MKWMKQLMFWQKDEVIRAGEISLNKYRDVYEKLALYDKGELKDPNIVLKLKDLRKLIQSN